MKQSTTMLLITDERLGHSNVHIDDDDFVDLLPRWQGISFDGELPSEEHKSADTTDLYTPDSESQPSNNDTNVEENVNSKGKGKLESVGEFEFPYSLQPPSFDLGVRSTQQSQLEAMASEEMQVYGDSVVSNVLKETISTEPKISNNFIVFVKQCMS
ncbi:Hypothetical predicted protein [Olea europaea subsp. europaea]|uniref:Uncharacterized protein n=1 Tax=Olea europaea subsp. europaea TaxID=158383 RepID=A0A8S0U2X3_OLEEU|nr:Hypothetical predicted protein [Olea europaea subsp. europaea]